VKKLFFATTVLILVIIFYVTTIRTTPFIVICSYVFPVYEGMEFFVEYTHSVNQSMMREFFVIRGEEIFFTALEFEDFGAGMPTDYEIIFLPEGGMRIEGFHTFIPQYTVPPTTVVRIGGGRIYLYDPEGGTQILIRQLNFWRRR